MRNPVMMNDTIFPKTLQLEADIFNERHCRDDDIPIATLQDVLQAYIDLGQQGAPWPTNIAEACEHNQMVQAKLDKLLLP